MALRRKADRGHELFPGFTDVHEIGVGSLAVVFRAREIGTNRLVALKLLNVRDASPRAIESFERESIALGALSSHPNIVTLYRTFRTADGRPVLVLELCSGAVSDRLRGGAGLPVPEAVSIGIKVAGALETAHRGGILHRDVKPQNILVTEFGEPALADFGVAMLQSSTQTTAGLFDFTTLHAAPELLEGAGTSAATDVYELASTLYQLIAGQSAFRAYEGESPASVILRILRDPVRPLSGVDVPIVLSDLLIRAMSKQMNARPPTAAEFAAELAGVEVAQGWPRTQFLVRGGAPTDGVPDITRLPGVAVRGAAVPPTPPPRQPPYQPVPPVPAPAPPASVPPPVPVPPVSVPPVSVPPLSSQPPYQPTPPPAPPPAPPPSQPPPSQPPGPPAPVPQTPARPTPPQHAPVPPASVPPAPSQPLPSQPLPSQPPGPPTPVPPPARPGPHEGGEHPLEPAAPGAVPVWAVRTPPPVAEPHRPELHRPEPHHAEPHHAEPHHAEPHRVWSPQFHADVSFDPTSLRRRATFRAGASSVVVDEAHLRVRTWFRRTDIAWSDVLGFETRDDPSSVRASGLILARTRNGPVELAGTRRPGAELREVRALLDAYRIRANMIRAGHVQ